MSACSVHARDLCASWLLLSSVRTCMRVKEHSFNFLSSAAVLENSVFLRVFYFCQRFSVHFFLIILVS